MAARREYAVGTDDVGRVDAADIETSTALHLFAAVPPPTPAVAADVLLGLEPAQALALCESSPFYQEICDSDGFRERYQNKWFVLAEFTTRGVAVFPAHIDRRYTYRLLRTRVVGDAKTLYERDTGVGRTDYNMLNAFDTSPNEKYVEFNMVNPTAQSSLGGMMDRAVRRQGIAYLGFDVIFLSVSASPSTNFTHFFENGEAIELSE